MKFRKGISSMKNDIYSVGKIALAGRVCHSTVVREIEALGIKPLLTTGGHKRLTANQAKKIVDAIAARREDPLERIMGGMA